MTSQHLTLTPDLQKLYAPKLATDECLEYCSHGCSHWIVAPYDGFGANLTYRRHRSLCWLKIADVPVQYPAWLHYPNGRVFYQEVRPASIEAIHWQPAPLPPPPPVDEDDAALRAFLDDASKPAKGDLAIFKAGREYERSRTK
jgi:hypothetical protein